jgi:hypothetical protein
MPVRSIGKAKPRGWPRATTLPCILEFVVKSAPDTQRLLTARMQRKDRSLPEGNAATLLDMLTRVPAAAVNGRRGLKYTQMDAEKPAAKHESLAPVEFS